MSEKSGRRLDMPVIGAGALASGGVALGSALLLATSVRTDGLGPTAAALNEAFSLLFGAAIGLAAGSACVAFAVRTGAPIVSGVVAGVLGYAIILAPVLIATAPSDFSVSESISTAALGAVLVTPAIVLGAALGALPRSRDAPGRDD